jgi:uncharacterized protein (DUF1501 family)
MVTPAAAHDPHCSQIDRRGTRLIGCSFVLLFAVTIIGAIGAATAENGDSRLKCIVVVILGGVGMLVTGPAYCCARRALKGAEKGERLIDSSSAS